MTTELIEKFVEDKNRKHSLISIHFKQRNTITGLFIQTADYEELKAKNFWRVVSAAKVGDWEKTRDINLARIFNGSEFTRLSDKGKD